MGYGRVMEASLDDIKGFSRQNRTAAQVSRHILNENSIKRFTGNHEKEHLEDTSIQERNISSSLSNNLYWVKHSIEGYVAAKKIDEMNLLAWKKV